MPAGDCLHARLSLYAVAKALEGTRALWRLHVGLLVMLDADIGVEHIVLTVSHGEMWFCVVESHESPS